MDKDWFSPGEIRFTRRQALWLVQNLGTLRDGRWPPEASNYIAMPSGKRTGRAKAYFTTPVEYAAEIETRLEQCNTDGLILEAIESWGKTVASMAKYLKMSEKSIGRRKKRALAYVASGPARRWHNTPKRKGKAYEEFISEENKEE